MTTTPNVPEERTENVFIQDIIPRYNAKGEPEYELKVVIPPSKYPSTMWVSAEVGKVLTPKTTVRMLLKRGNPSKGKYGSDSPLGYYWDFGSIVWPGGQETGHATSNQGSTATKTVDKEQDMEQGILHEHDWAGPFYHDITEQAHGRRISWAQAVNAAIQVIGEQAHQEYPDVGYLEETERWANLLYPLIRKGPTRAAGASEPLSEENSPPTTPEAPGTPPSASAEGSDMPYEAFWVEASKLGYKGYGSGPTVADVLHDPKWQEHMPRREALERLRKLPK